MSKKMTPTDIQILRVKLENIIQARLEEGYYLRPFEDIEGDISIGQPGIDNYFGCCLLGIATAADDPGRTGIWTRRQMCQKLLNLGEEEVDTLEAGFEHNYGVLPKNVRDPLYQLGAYLREKYV